MNPRFRADPRARLARGARMRSRRCRRTKAARKLKDALGGAVFAGQMIQVHPRYISHTDLHLYRFQDTRPCGRAARGPDAGNATTTPGRALSCRHGGATGAGQAPSRRLGVPRRPKPPGARQAVRSLLSAYGSRFAVTWQHAGLLACALMRYRCACGGWKWLRRWPCGLRLSLLRVLRRMPCCVTGRGAWSGAVLYIYWGRLVLQRRHQKVVEEAPAVGLAAGQRQALAAVGLRDGAGRRLPRRGHSGVPVRSGGAVYFIEMNTRIQVEHAVTEMITGVDLVEWQLRVPPASRCRSQQRRSGAMACDRGAPVCRGARGGFSALERSAASIRAAGLRPGAARRDRHRGGRSRRHRLRSDARQADRLRRGHAPRRSQRCRRPWRGADRRRRQQPALSAPAAREPRVPRRRHRHRLHRARADAAAASPAAVPAEARCWPRPRSGASRTSTTGAKWPGRGARSPRSRRPPGSARTAGVSGSPSPTAVCVGTRSARAAPAQKSPRSRCIMAARAIGCGSAGEGPGGAACLGARSVRASNWRTRRSSCRSCRMAMGSYRSGGMMRITCYAVRTS